MTIHDFLAVARAAARMSADKKARDVEVFDVRRISSLADFYVVATADSSTQLQAVQGHIDQALHDEFSLNPVRQEGSGGGTWNVLDYGGVVIHLMHPAAREFYGLERLWEGARKVNWETPAKPAPRKAAKPPRRKTASRKT